MRAIETSLKNLFSSGFFKIPDYQRPYAWKEKNRKDLYEDITASAKNKEPHYLGTISLKRYNNGGIIEYDIIDGQQRLTTLYLFSLAFYTVYSERNLWKNQKQKILFEANFLKEDERIRLELGNLNKDFFSYLVEQILENGSKGLKNIKESSREDLKLETNKRLLDTIDDFIRRLNREPDTLLETIYKFMESEQLNLVKLEVNDDVLAIKIFEVINDRGLPLNYIDKFKSHLMFLITRNNLDIRLESINSKFGSFFSIFDTIKSLGRDLKNDYVDKYLQDDDFLVYLYHYSYKFYLRKFNLEDKLSYEYNIYKQDVWYKWLRLFDLVRHNPRHLQNLINNIIVDLIGLAASFLELLETATSNKVKKLTKLIIFLQPNVRTWHFLTTLQLKGFLNDDLIQLAESMDVRIYKVRGTDPRRDLYLNVISELKDSNQFPLQALNDFIKAYGSDAEFEHYLKRDMYGNTATKYILWELNELNFLQKLEEKFNISLGEIIFTDLDRNLYQRLEVEHIFPQEFIGDFKAFKFQDEAEYRKFLNVLGNLTLLESDINKECSNLLPVEKATNCYYKSNVPYTSRFLTQYMNQYNFDKFSIQSLTNYIVELAKQRFPIPS